MVKYMEIIKKKYQSSLLTSVCFSFNAKRLTGKNKYFMAEDLLWIKFCVN